MKNSALKILAMIYLEEKSGLEKRFSPLGPNADSGREPKPETACGPWKGTWNTVRAQRNCGEAPEVMMMCRCTPRWDLDADVGHVGRTESMDV